MTGYDDPIYDDYEDVTCFPVQRIIVVSTATAVVRSHILEGKDFFTYEPTRWDVMLSNPPFSGKANIFRRALSFGKPFGPKKITFSTAYFCCDLLPRQIIMDSLKKYEDRP